jgi:hypothetical protein
MSGLKSGWSGPALCVMGYPWDGAQLAKHVGHRLARWWAARRCEPRSSVKPSAQPTLVRTQHLPPAKPQVSMGFVLVSRLWKERCYKTRVTCTAWVRVRAALSSRWR